MSDYEREEDDDDDDRPRSRRRRERSADEEPHRGTMILLLGIGSIIVPFMTGCAPVGIVIAIMAWKWGKKDMALMDEGLMDPDGRSSTQAGMICGIIGTVLNGLYFLLILVYVVVVAGFLVFAANNPPPPPNAAPMPVTNKAPNNSIKPADPADFKPKAPATNEFK